MAEDESGCSQLVAVVQAAQFHCRHPGPHHTTIASTQSTVLLLDANTRDLQHQHANITIIQYVSHRKCRFLIFRNFELFHCFD